jgi:hypothetical protein
MATPKKPVKKNVVEDKKAGISLAAKILDGSKKPTITDAKKLAALVVGDARNNKRFPKGKN